MSISTATRAGREERQRLREDFVALCEIESPSRRERRVADWVTQRLRALGLQVREDGTAAETGSDAGNLLAAVDGPDDAPVLLFCAHLDTVPLADRVEVVEEEGVLRNRHHAILGADNKAAVAALVALAGRLVRQPAPVGVELLFTTCEELALAGIKAFDRSALRASYGFVFDHASPIGELVLAAPTYYRITSELHGHAAHAGLRPEAGRNAIAAAAAGIAALRFGRLDDATTANVGRIEGGTAPNVVAERCRVELEARSLDAARAAEVAGDIVGALAEAASDRDCDVETEVEEQFRGYRLARTAAPVVAATRALQGLGIEVRHIATGGGSDANVLVARGLPCLNVANGTERNHEPGECVTVEALETGLDVALGIVANAQPA